MRFGPFVISETCVFPPAQGPQCWVYVTLNAEIALSLPHSAGLRLLLGQQRTRISIDGQWLWWALRRKYPTRPLVKLSGSDLIYAIARHCARQGLKLMLMGGAPAANAAAACALQQRTPGLDVIGFAPAYDMADSAAEAAAQSAALAAIRRARPHYVVLGLGAMKEHRLAAVLAPQLDACVNGLLCFGGAIDIAAGVYRRAPRGLQRLGVEGLYRVWQDPSRAWRLMRVLRILPVLARGHF